MATYKDAPREVRDRIREELERYCCLDTEGMILIINKLQEL